MIVLLLIFIALCFVYYLKILSNKDIVKQGCKTEQDKANVKNARKTYSSTITVKILLGISIISLIVIVLMQFTNIEYLIKDFISAEIIEETSSFSYKLYFIPLYVFISRQIIIEVNLGDFLYKFFNIEEPELEENPVKMILEKTPLYKKAPVPKGKTGEQNMPKEKEEK